MAWTPEELRRIGEADELQVSSTRPDGTDRPFVTIWGVRSGDDLYVRSAYGTDNPWYRRALASGTGRVRGGGAELAVAFTAMDPADAALQSAVDAAYRGKYAKYPARIVNTVVGETAHLTTVRLDPR